MNLSPKGNNSINDLHGDNKYKPIEEEIFLRPLSRRLALLLKNTPIHADHLSVLGFLLTVICAVLIAGSVVSVWLIALLLFICNFFDKADGDLARTKGTAGTKGQYIDGFLDVFGEIALIIGFAYIADPSLLLFALTITAPLVFVYHGVSAPFYLKLVPNPHIEKSKASGFRTLFYYGRAKFFIICILAIVLKFPLLVFYTLPILLLYTITLFLRNIFIKKLTTRS